MAAALLVTGCTAGKALAPPAGSEQGDAAPSLFDSGPPSTDDSGDALGSAKDAEQDEASSDAAALDGGDGSVVTDDASLDAQDASTPDAASDAPPVVGCYFPRVECPSGCTDLNTDPNNCGSCGHDCQGGACATGACQPVLLASTSALGGVGENIAVDPTNVYWSWAAAGGARPRDFAVTDCLTTGACVMSTPKAGGTSTTLAAGLAPLAINATSVFYETSSAVMSVPLSGGTATTLDAPPCVAVAADSANVYWTSDIPLKPAVLSAPVTGGTPTTLATGQAPRAIAVDAHDVYFTDAMAGTINAVPIGGGSVTVLATGQPFSTNIVVDSTNVYWTTASTNTTGSVVSMPLSGGPPTTLAAGPGYGGPIAVDSANVYFSGPGGLISMPRGGGTSTTLAGSQGANAIAVDSTSVYWTVNPANYGWLMKLAKP